MKKLLMLLVVLGALAGGVAIGQRLSRTRVPDGRSPAAQILYHCPMHPQVVSEVPGHCPICHMQFVPFTPEGAVVGSTGEASKKTVWRSTMIPGETSDHPGKDSMGMEMVPVEVEGSVPGVAGQAAVSLDDAARHLVGARTVPVERTAFVKKIRTTGRVAIDDTRMQHIHTKVQGWIEHLHVGAEGEPVRAGQPLLSIYSPELLASQKEYLIALDNRARAIRSTLPGVLAEAEQLVESSRQRLLLQDLGSEQIAALQLTRVAQRIVTLYSPVSGTIAARNVSHGERVESATSLLDIADLSRVWIVADVYESDLPYVHAGQDAEITLPYLAGRTYHARIELLSPLVDPVSRTIRARFQLENADLALKPGMFVDVTLGSDLGERLSIPKDAVIRTGPRNIVFVAAEGGSFTPREVSLGLELPDRWEILSGVSAGERILDPANFFVDSESKLKAAAAGARP